MLENDQILVINGTPLDQSVTQHQAIALLQEPGDRVDLVVARDPATITQHTHTAPPPLPPGPSHKVRVEHTFMYLSMKMFLYCHVMVLSIN